MKIYSLLSMECGCVNTWKTFKNKDDAIKFAKKILKKDEVKELIENEYYSDDNGYEVYLNESELD